MTKTSFESDPVYEVKHIESGSEIPKIDETITEISTKHSETSATTREITSSQTKQEVVTVLDSTESVLEATDIEALKRELAEQTSELESNGKVAKTVSIEEKSPGSSIVTTVTTVVTKIDSKSSPETREVIEKTIKESSKEPETTVVVEKTTEVISSDKSEDAPKASDETPEKNKPNEVEAKVDSWGKPMNLPSPTGLPSKPKASSESNAKQEKASAVGGRRSLRTKQNPVYLDLAYVPHHGDSLYTDVEFFWKVQARYYVFSGVEPSAEVLSALLEAKKSWEDKDLGKLFFGSF